MTSIVLALYIADLCSSVRFCMGLVALLSLIGLLACIICFIFLRIDRIGNIELRNTRRIIRRLEKFWLYWSKVIGAILAVAVLVTTAIPSDRTLYAYIGIAATQTIAKQVADSPRMQKVLDLVDTKLDEVLKEKQKDDKR